MAIDKSLEERIQKSISTHSRIYKRPSDGVWNMKWYGSAGGLMAINRDFIVPICSMGGRKLYSTHDFRIDPTNDNIDYVMYVNGALNVFKVLFFAGMTNHPMYISIKSDIYNQFRHLEGQDDAFLTSLSPARAYGLKPKYRRK